MQKVINYHFHIYYSQESIKEARELASLASENFPISIGRFHEKPVGPHPMWSVQLTIKTEDFGQVLGWFVFNHKDLILFIHPNTGNDLIDHTEHAIWLGRSVELNLELFQ